MPSQNTFKVILKLAFISILAGFATGVLELYIGHRFILDKLLANDPNFVYESFFAPTYYGFVKSFVIALTFFSVYLLMPKNKIKPIITGIAATLLFGFYYYLIFPHSFISSAIIIGIVHFSFIAGIAYILAKISKL